MEVKRGGQGREMTGWDGGALLEGNQKLCFAMAVGGEDAESGGGGTAVVVMLK